MARQRRGGGFKPPELRGTLGTLINTALSQAGVVRDALERGARSMASEGRSRLDEARTSRKRHDALAELGEIVLDLIRRGEIDLAELPEARELVHHLDDLDDSSGRAEPDDDDDYDDRDVVARAPSRSRFDARTRSSGPTKDERPSRRASDDDGTVSSTSSTRSKPTAPQRVWRPNVEDEPQAPAAPAARATRKTLPNNPSRKGGIAFDDEDLADYMHPDDVPPKNPSDGDP